jgi:hypothetical protein
LEEKLCLVELSCGSRLVEILLVSLYSDVSEWTPDTWKDPDRRFGTLDDTIDIVVERIAKDRMLKGAKRDLLGDETQQEDVVVDVADDGGEIIDRLIARPVLFGIAPTKMLELIGEIRTELNSRYPRYDTLSYTDVRDKEWITKQVNKSVNTEVKKAFPSLKKINGGRTGSHDLRRMYVSLSYQEYGSHTSSEIGWAKAVLGHTSSATSRAYLTVRVQRNPPKLLVNAEPRFTAIDHRFDDLQKELGELKKQFDTLRDRGAVVSASRQAQEGYVFLPGKGNTQIQVRKEVARRDGTEAKLNRMRLRLQQWVELGVDEIQMTDVRKGNKKRTEELWISVGFGSEVTRVFLKK